MREFLHLGDELAIVHVGRLSNPKNHKFLLKIFDIIHQFNPKSKLYLIGEGELREEIELLIKLIGLDNAVTLLGSVPNVYDYLQAMDAMVFPSLYEGFPTTVLESQCCGLPTLASNVITKSTQITDCLDFLSLEKAPDVWAEKTLEMCNRIERKDRSSEIRAAGYDIKDTYKMLSEFYLNHI